MNKSKSILNVIAWIFFIIFLIGAVAFLVFRVGGYNSVKDIFIPNSSSGEFSVKYENKVYMKDNNDVAILPIDGLATFYVTGADEYSIAVSPNTDFVYTLNGLGFNFSNAPCQSYILPSSNVYSGYFVIDCDKDLSPCGVLSSQFNNSKIELPYYDALAYKLVVISKRGKIEIPFAQSSIPTNIVPTLNIEL